MQMTFTPHHPIDLTHLHPTPRRLRIGLGWTQTTQPTGLMDRLLGRASVVDLDAACLMLGHTGDLIDMIWFKKLRALDDSVRHRGDSTNGQPVSVLAQHNDDDESIDVDLKKIADSVHYLFFTVCSYTGHNFEDIAHAHCRVVDSQTDQDIAHFDLSQRGAHTGLIMACLSRQDDGWVLHAIGEPVNARTPEDLISRLQQWRPR
jgi:tellurium resistance protein TerZ